ncbi:MAG: 2-C-methyl-D-erythritol 2,4-cyclodiphosphate synthase [Christensenellaceae bacterium]|nr:2-C-methyl-D-erythritol 2,4-cyclodiphosphate synthase [Christensenellaceae bacterium]
MWCAIILAGGSGSRMGAGMNKVLLPVGGVPAIIRSVRAFASLMDGLVVVSRAEDEAAIRGMLDAAGLPATVVHGGDTRQASVWNGLCALPEGCGRVLIHDGARCLVDEDTIRRAMASVEAYGTGVAAVPVVDTIKQADAEGIVMGTPDRAALRAMQTPQGFDAALIRRAHEAAQRDGCIGTDDAALVERLGVPVRLTEGSRRNLKLTTPEDIAMAEALLNETAPLPCLRVGQGYDVHRLVEGRPLILCGVTVPHKMGLLGHSDADVALHALMDAMLGAMALGDIGRHFPDTDERYRGISSMLLLKHVAGLLGEHHARVTSADVTIVAQRPKLLPYIPQMRQHVADALGLPLDRVNVKATTTERLGFEGREEGISAQAVCVVEQR